MVKANAVANAFILLSIGTITHVMNEWKELAKYIHRIVRLGFCLTDLVYGGIIVQNSSEYSLVMEFKAKKNNDPILLNWKKFLTIRKGRFSPKSLEIEFHVSSYFMI